MAVRTVTRRGKRRLVIDFSFRKPDGSKGRYRHDAEVQTLAAARAEERRRLAALASTGSPFEVVDPVAREQVTAASSHELTFEKVVDRYLAEFAPSQLKPSTRHGYESAIRAWLKPHFGKLPLRTIDAKAVRDFDTAMVRGGLHRSTSRRAILIVLYSIVCRFAVEADLLDKASKLPKLPKVGKTIPYVMKPAEFVAVLEKGCTCPEHRLAFLLSGHGGLRRGEIRALRCGDVDLANNRLVVRTAICRGVEGPPKSGHEREVPLTPELRDALMHAGVKERPREERASLTVEGKPWGEAGVRNAFVRALRRAEVPKWRLHDLRHFFVTALLNSGIPPHVVRELAGHADLATTQRYAHATAGDCNAAIVALSAACGMGKKAA